MTKTGDILAFEYPLVRIQAGAALIMKLTEELEGEINQQIAAAIDHVAEGLEDIAGSAIKIVHAGEKSA